MHFMILAVQTTLIAPASLGWVFLLVLAAWSLRVLRDPETTKSPGWKWWALVAVTLLCFRWPILWVQHQLNPDESQLIAGAITLRYDPVFWRSVDGGTAGPIDFYPLLPAAWADGFFSYTIARLIGLAATFGTIVLAGETVAIIAGQSIARIAVLPAIAFYAFTASPDFVHCSTEVMPVLLLAAAAYAAVGGVGPPSRGRLWTVALLLGCVPWAKPQAAPLAIALWAVVAWRECRAGRAASLIQLIGAALLPAVACFAMAISTGQTEHMVVPYLLRNLNYVREAPLPWAGRVQLQWQNALTDGFLALWLAGTALFTVVALLRLHRAPAPLRRAVLAAGVLVIVAGWSAFAPSRPSTHHLLLVTAPLIWVGGMALAVAWSAAAAPVAPMRRLVIAGLFLCCGLLPQLVWRARAGDRFAAYTTADVRPTRRQLTSLVRQFSAPGESLAVWGWRSSLYVEANRRQATRQAQTEAQIYANPLQAYFLRRYFEDLTAANPPVFADAVGPGNFAFENRERAHECFPPLREWIATHYTQIADLDGTRLYVRNDRLPVGEHALPAAPGP